MLASPSLIRGKINDGDTRRRPHWEEPITLLLCNICIVPNQCFYIISITLKLIKTDVLAKVLNTIQVAISDLLLDQGIFD